ncbi:hypothetical protein [Asticcacaulis solisilvae]|uniref:hypothetical protein n=1 Tax=Asticcacaulis solisilvae TaxID=1217274 RepID=UPI003FD7072D
MAGETKERQTPDGLKKDGYNAGIEIPVSVEPLPKSRMGQAVDVRTLKGEGVVDVHDDDDEILDQDRSKAPGKPSP